MPGIVAPQDFPFRKPTDANQNNGRVVNPVRFMELGNLSSGGKWAKGNQMAVEKPSRVNATKSSKNKSDD